jgi:hypothetical protein
MAELIITRGEGGLGRPLPNKDHVSGLLCFLADVNLPGAFTTSNRIIKFFSISEVEAQGIVKGGANGIQMIWYHAREYFRAQPKGELYIGIYDNTNPDMSKIEDIQNFANGDIRQIGVFNQVDALAVLEVTALQTSANTLATAHRPLSVVYGANIVGVADLTTLPDLRAQTSERVSVVIGQDGNAEGAAIATTEGVSLTTVGLVLGTMSLAKVHENIGYVAKFNLVGGASNEMDTPNFGNGNPVSAQTETALKALNDKGYIFQRKYTDFAGTYHFDSPTSVIATSDYAYIENNRTIDKAVRGVRVNLLPSLNSPIEVNADGSLTESVASQLQNDAQRFVDQMVVDGELSNSKVIINPAQDVLATSKVEITIQLQPIGVLRTIEVTIGFVANITN